MKRVRGDVAKAQYVRERGMQGWAVGVLAACFLLTPQLAHAQGEDSRSSKGPGFGIYGDALAMLALTPGGSSHEWDDSCPEQVEGSCETKSPIGVLLEGRLGLRFGYLGIEALGILAGDWSKASFDGQLSTQAPGLRADMHVGRVGGGLGGGVRFLTAPGIVRFTTGLNGGIMFRHVYSNVSSLDGTSTGYRAPFLSLDANVLLLGFLSVGIQGFLEFHGPVTLEPNLGEVSDEGQQVDQELGEIEVYHGTEFFLGPVVGIHLGG